MNTMMRRKMKHRDWLKLGRELYGKNPLNWKFQCISCGNVQSVCSVMQRNPELTDADAVLHWIGYACEGRHTEDVGCDWSLGGLFHLHHLEVIISAKTSDATKPMPVFEFADDPEREDPFLMHEKNYAS